MRDQTTEALSRLGFTMLPAGAGELRALRGHCEVHLHQDGDGVSMAIPVVRLGPDRSATVPLSTYLSERNQSGKGPGAFSLEGDTVWYRVYAPVADSETVAAAALAMQTAAEKIGPKILNILR